MSPSVLVVHADPTPAEPLLCGLCAQGQVIARVQLPVSQASCVAFGGPHLRTLYITTARVGLSQAQLAHQADAGALFKVELPWVGLPEAVFGQG